MRNMKKLIKILIILSILFLFIGSVSASDNTTTISKEKCKIKTKNVVDKNRMLKFSKKKPHLTFKVDGKTLRITEKEYYRIKAHKYDGYDFIKPTRDHYVIKKKMKTIQRLYFNSFHKNKRTAIKMELKTIRPYLKNGYVITGVMIKISAGDGYVYLIYGAHGINYFRKGDFHTEAIYSPRLHRYLSFDVTKYF